MSTKPSAPRKPRVAKDARSTPRTGATLIRLGVGRQEFVLPEGATLSTLLREAGVDSERAEITIDGLRLAEHLVLREGMIVTVNTRTNGANPPPWLAGSGMFRDDSAFEELMKGVEETRNAEKDGS